VTSETVVLVHGHGAHPVLLEPLRRAFERAGFRVVNWRYGSLRGSIETHAARLAAKAKELDDEAGIERLHFVGHSMGAIVVRRALAMARPRKLGRVVLLAPPNRGARLADLGLKVFGQRLTAATELCSHPDSYVTGSHPRLILIAASSRHRGTMSSRLRRRTCPASAITWCSAVCTHFRYTAACRHKWCISSATAVSSATKYPAVLPGCYPAKSSRSRR
jgi:pimeloyl-ACP methyl ester carboxylesterase